MLEGGKRAAQLGFATANIALDDASVSGIYAARVEVGGKTYDAVTYADHKRGVLESHLFSFSGDLYGKGVIVELLEKLRDEMVFTNEALARAQIQKDVAAARRYFRHT